MCDTFSGTNRVSFGGCPGYGAGYDYGQPAPGHAYAYPPPAPAAFDYGGPSPPAYDNHNPHHAPPQPQSKGQFDYPHDSRNSYGIEKTHGSRGENASYYGNDSFPPQSHGPSPATCFNGPSPQPVPYPNMHPTPMSGPGSCPGPAPMNMNMNMNNLHPSAASGPPPGQTPAPRSLVLRQSPKTHKVILIHPSGAPPSSPPLYSLTSSPKASKADYVLARGADPNDSSAETASVKSHTFSSKYDLLVRGTNCVLKESSSGTGYKIDIPGVGVYKWHIDEENLSSKMWLKDASGVVLASYDKSREKSSVGAWKKFVGGKDRELTMNVPLSEFFVEVLLVSLYAVKMAKEGALEAAVEIINAVAGS
ncbi:hypothetical protein BDV18DRAFT_128039 [Aspergillus unguis]